MVPFDQPNENMYLMIGIIIFTKSGLAGVELELGSADVTVVLGLA